MGKGRGASTISGLVLSECAPYMALIIGRALYYNNEGLNKFYLGVDEIKAAGEKEEDYDYMEGIGKVYIYTPISNGISLLGSIGIDTFLNPVSVMK